MNIDIQYDVPILVTEDQYRRLIVKCAGIIAHRQEEGKFYIKVLLMKHANFVKNILQE